MKESRYFPSYQGEYDHITLILFSSHWLPVCFSIDFKFLLITFKAFNGLAPEYIRDLLIPYEPARSLRSSNRGLPSVHPCGQAEN